LIALATFSQHFNLKMAKMQKSTGAAALILDPDVVESDSPVFSAGQESDGLGWQEFVASPVVG
jgi:hypothetical protein